MPDFIGYSCTTLTSLIREEVSKYTFEDFHKNSVGIIRQALFKKISINDSKGKPQEKFGNFFPEIYFLVTEIDVKQIIPVNKEINNLLNQSIKNNMRIVCDKMEQDARLLAQKDKIIGDQEIGKLQAKLIDIENANLKLDQVEKARIKGRVKVLEATYEKQSEELTMKAKQGVEIERMKKIIDLLNSSEGKKYLELLQAENISKIDQQWFVTSTSNLQLPFDKK